MVAMYAVLEDVVGEGVLDFPGKGTLLLFGAIVMDVWGLLSWIGFGFWRNCFCRIRV